MNTLAEIPGRAPAPPATAVGMALADRERHPAPAPRPFPPLATSTSVNKRMEAMTSITKERIATSTCTMASANCCPARTTVMTTKPCTSTNAEPMADAPVLMATVVRTARAGMRRRRSNNEVGQEYSCPALQ